MRQRTSLIDRDVAANVDLVLSALAIAEPKFVRCLGGPGHSRIGLIIRPLTVIGRDMNAIGESAARLLLDRLGAGAKQPPRTITVNSEIILRQSRGPARK